MKHDLVINGIVIEDLEASRDYLTAKELVLEEYLRQAAGQGKDTPTVFAQGDGRAVVVIWGQVAPIEARLKSEDPRKAPDFDIMKTIGLDALHRGEEIRAPGADVAAWPPAFSPGFRLAQGVLLPGHLPQGGPEPGDLIECGVAFGGELGELGAGLGKLGVLLADFRGQVPDPGGELGGAGLGDLVA